MPRIRLTAPCPRLVMDPDDPDGEVVPCEGVVSCSGWCSAPGDYPDADVSDWGVCDCCGGDNWTREEEQVMADTSTEHDVDREGWADHRDEYLRERYG